MLRMNDAGMSVGQSHKVYAASYRFRIRFVHTQRARTPISNKAKHVPSVKHTSMKTTFTNSWWPTLQQDRTKQGNEIYNHFSPRTRPKAESYISVACAENCFRMSTI